MTMRIDVPEGKHPVMFAWGEAVPLGTGAPAGLDTPSPGGLPAILSATESLARPLLASASDPMSLISCMPVRRAIPAQAEFSKLPV